MCVCVCLCVCVCVFVCVCACKYIGMLVSVFRMEYVCMYAGDCIGISAGDDYRFIQGEDNRDQKPGLPMDQFH